MIARRSIAIPIRGGVMGFVPPAEGSSEFARRMTQALQDPPRDVDPWFFEYCGDLAQAKGMRTYLRAKQQLLELVDGVRGKDVLDAGSGFGAVSHVLASWGARRVYSIEVHAPMVASHRLVRRQHFANLEQVHQLRGTVSAIPLRDQSVDLVISIEAVSHYYDVARFLDECARVLRPGGHLLISDGNNGANPKVREATIGLWERFELGPHGPHMGHVISETMIDRRERFLRERYPQLDAARVQALARVTSGTGPDELARAIDLHLAGGPAPNRPYVRGTCPRDPHWGYWVEWLFDPRGLVMELTNRGFSARAWAHYGGADNDLFLAANRLLRRLPGFRFAKAFRVVAQRNGPRP
jgi:SAM-dependent methyltransferase